MPTGFAYSFDNGIEKLIQGDNGIKDLFRIKDVNCHFHYIHRVTNDSFLMGCVIEEG